MHEARHRTGVRQWRIRPRALAALAVASMGLATSIWVSGRNDVAEAAERRSWFSDDFDAAGLTVLDTSKWLLDGGAEQGFQDGDGNLRVTRLMGTRRAFAEPYGRAEARIKVRRHTGVWRAFGVINERGEVLRGQVEVLDPEADQTSGSDFHTYRVDWSPTSIEWSVDGVPALRLTPEEPGLALAFVLNLATDGRRPVTMIVDFVRVVSGSMPPVEPSPSASGDPTSSDEPSDESSDKSSSEPSSEPPSSELPPTDPTGEPSNQPTYEPTTPPATTEPSVTEPPATTTPTTAPPAPTAPPATTKPPAATKPPATKPPATSKPPATAKPPAKPPAKAKAWKAYTAYKAGDRVTYKGVTYVVRESHTALPGWLPSSLPSLFKRV